MSTDGAHKAPLRAAQAVPPRVSGLGGAREGALSLPVGGLGPSPVLGGVGGLPVYRGGAAVDARGGKRGKGGRRASALLGDGARPVAKAEPPRRRSPAGLVSSARPSSAARAAGSPAASHTAGSRAVTRPGGGRRRLEPPAWRRARRRQASGTPRRDRGVRGRCAARMRPRGGARVHGMTRAGRPAGAGSSRKAF